MTNASIALLISFLFLRIRVETSVTKISIQMALISVKVSDTVILACHGYCDGCTGAGNLLCEACESPNKEIEDAIAGVRC